MSAENWYYQRSIPGFDALASPLHDLRRKALSDGVTWSEAAEGAFSLLRQALCSEPLLITPDFTLPLLIHTGASAVGLGAELGLGGASGDLHQQETPPQ